MLMKSDAEPVGDRHIWNGWMGRVLQCCNFETVGCRVIPVC